MSQSAPLKITENRISYSDYDTIYSHMKQRFEATGVLPVNVKNNMDIACEKREHFKVG